MSDPRELPPLGDALEVLALLRAGDTLAREAAGWRLVRADVAVTPDVVELLRFGGPLLEPYGGILAPMGDQLPGFPAHHAQTWRWADEKTKARH